VATSEAQFETADQLPPNDPVADATGTGAGGKRHGRRVAYADGARHTRISGAWVAVAVAVVLGAALVDFIVQNTRSVRIEFFAASGHIPVAVALLVAALAGAFLVLAVGIARTTQLRLANRRGKKLQKQTESLVTDSQT
jgi:uncharacterized integral membrane protein